MASEALGFSSPSVHPLTGQARGDVHLLGFPFLILFGFFFFPCMVTPRRRPNLFNTLRAAVGSRGCKPPARGRLGSWKGALNHIPEDEQVDVSYNNNNNNNNNE